MVPSSDNLLLLTLFILRILSPAIVLLSTLTLFPASPPQPSSPSPITSVVVASRIPRRALILSLLSFVSFAYLFDGLTYVVFVVLNKHWTITGIDINAVLGIIAFSGMAALGAWKDVHGVDVWSFKRVKHAVNLSLDVDIAIVVLIALDIKQRTDGPKIPETKYPISLAMWLHLAFAALRVLLLIPLTFALFNPRTQYTPVQPDDEIIAPQPTSSSLLLPPNSGVPTSAGLSPLSAGDQDRRKYGTFSANRWSTPTTRAPTPTIPTSMTVPLQKADEKPEIALDPSWKELGRRIRRLTPYLWPSKSKPLQLLALFCILLLVVGRLVNVLLPLTLGELVKTLEEGQGRWSPWVLLGGYVILRFLQSSGGLSALRDSLWAPVMQYSDREMSQLSFDHLLNLSFAWHTRRKTGEILRILDRGAAVNHTLELIMFNVIPTFFDIIIALVVFIVKFEWTLALVIFVVMFAYVAASVILTRWRTKIRRQMNERDVITRGIHTDCLLNYETVKYFGGETHEGERYADAIRQYQVLEYKVTISLNLLNLVQNFIITLGLLVGSMIVALRVVNGDSKPSDFVIFITYLAQLYGPLNSLGYIYRSINQSLVDTEKLLKLLNEPTEVNDKPNAPDLVVDDGEIEFDNVSFSYDGRNPALSSVSFKVPKNGSVALVGESGSGKSTILRLLYRFYDLREGEGRILIDGKDIRDVTQASLRRSIGVVPQDSVLFNSSIAYNIGYGKFGASRTEIEVAAKAAQMHDRITSFPDGYDTKVGERGVRLSGGEKQRVAIARTLLKNPPILLLDEATSALDTSTEKDIQKALQNLVKGRSSLSIAHRLSTIASADIILVLKDGQIVEQGSHRDLLAKDGIFASMWADQISASDDPAISIGNSSTKKEVSGYSADPLTDMPITGGDPTEAPQVDTGDLSAAGGASRATDVAAELTTPVSFPTYAAVANPDVPTDAPAHPSASMFPTAGDTASQRATSVRDPSSASPQAVTFGSGVDTPPSSAPDVDGEPKKKGISAQNFQRLARRISLTTRRSGSMSSMPHIPGFGPKKESSKDETSSLKGELSAGHAGSPSGSISGVGDKDKKTKKEKKEKKRKSLI